MSEILFRAKSIIADSPDYPGYWREGFLLVRELPFETGTVYEHHIVDIKDYLYVDLSEDTEVWPETIGRFTGRLDKHGKKIFEGDIVKTKYGRLCEVIWFDSRMQMGWDLKPVNTRENIWHTQAPDTYDIWDSKNLEVVGNRWEAE